MKEWTSEDGAIRLINADCRDVLPVECDAVVTDPPYGIGYDRNEKHKGTVEAPTILGDNEPFDPAHLLFCEKAVLWGANCYGSRLPDNPPWLCWQKTLTDNDDGQTADFELAWARGATRSRRKVYLWAGCYRANGAEEGFIHPTQKPVAIMAWSIEQVKTPQGATVLDPYAGSGTTGIACIRTGRKFIGIERDEKYYAIALARIQKELQQGLLPL